MKKKINALAIPNEVIQKRIYFIRAHKVMIDRDLARLYKVTTGNFNKAIQRNLKRFPKDFMFKLNADEFRNLIFQFATSKNPKEKNPT
jgi:hypothetical protein